MGFIIPLCSTLPEFDSFRHRMKLAGLNVGKGDAAGKGGVS